MTKKSTTEIFTKIPDLLSESLASISAAERKAHSDLILSRQKEIVSVRLVNDDPKSPSRKVKWMPMEFVLNNAKMIIAMKHSVQDPQWADKLQRHCEIEKLNIDLYKNLKY